MKMKKSKPEQKKIPLTPQKVAGSVWKVVSKVLLTIFLLAVIFSMVALPLLLVLG